MGSTAALSDMCLDATAQRAALLDVWLDSCPDLHLSQHGGASNQIRPIVHPGHTAGVPRCQHDRVSTDRARDRTFVVTGVASGIGLATARRLLAEGGTVVGADVAAPPDLGPEFRRHGQLWGQRGHRRRPRRCRRRGSRSSSQSRWCCSECPIAGRYRSTVRRRWLNGASSR